MTAMPLYGIYIYSLMNWWALYELSTGTQSTKEKEGTTHKKELQKEIYKLTTKRVVETKLVSSDVKRLLKPL